MIVEPQFFKSSKFLKLRQNTKIILVSGCFTHFNINDEDQIRYAQNLGTVISLVNNDISTKKQREYSFLSEGERIKIVDDFNKNGYSLLSQTENTDISHEIELILPDIFLKGYRYNLQKLPQKEIDVCRKIGCEILFYERQKHASEFYNSLDKFNSW